MTSLQTLTLVTTTADGRVPVCSVASLFLAKPWHLHPLHVSWHPLGLQPSLNYFSKAFFRADTCSSFPSPIRRCERLQDILKLESSPGYTLQLRPRFSPLEPPHLSKSLLSHPPDHSFHGSWPVGWWARRSLLRKTPFVAASNVVPLRLQKTSSSPSPEMIFNFLNLWPEIGLANSLLPSKSTDKSSGSDDFDPQGTMFGDIFYCHNLLEGSRYGL